LIRADSRLFKCFATWHYLASAILKKGRVEADGFADSGPALPGNAMAADGFQKLPQKIMAGT
jgi:hypothetical protein